MSAGAWLRGDRARAMGGGKLPGGAHVQVFEAGGEGAVMRGAAWTQSCSAARRALSLG